MHRNLGTSMPNEGILMHSLASHKKKIAPRPRHAIFLLALPVLLAATPARAGFFDALDTLMKNYANGVVDQGDKAIATVKAVVQDPPEGQSRMEALDAALRTYAGTYHEDGTLGGNALADVKSLGKALIDAIKSIPEALKKLWDKLIGGLIGSSAEFEGRVETTWEEAEEQSDESNAGSTSAAGSGSDSTAGTGSDDTATGVTTESGADAAPETAGAGSGAAIEDAVSTADATENPKATPEGETASDADSATNRASSTRETRNRNPEDLFSAYTRYLASALEMRDFITSELEPDNQQGVIPAFEAVMQQAAKMQEHLAERITSQALAGRPSLDDLQGEIGALPQETARYAYTGVIHQIRDLLADQKSDAAIALTQRVEEIAANLAP